MFTPESTLPRPYSFFYPGVIVLLALIISYGAGVYTLQKHRSALHAQYLAAAPSLDKAQNAQNRFVSLMRDLVATSHKSAVAAQVLREAVAAGYVRGGGPPEGAAAPAPSADGSAPAAAPTSTGVPSTP